MVAVRIIACLCLLVGVSLQVDVKSGKEAGKAGNFMEDEQWLSTISQYSRKIKHWNRFRDVSVAFGVINTSMRCRVFSSSYTGLSEVFPVEKAQAGFSGDFCAQLTVNPKCTYTQFYQFVHEKYFEKWKYLHMMLEFKLRLRSEWMRVCPCACIDHETIQIHFTLLLFYFLNPIRCYTFIAFLIKGECQLCYCVYLQLKLTLFVYGPSCKWMQVNTVKPKGNLRHMVSKAISKLLLGNCDTLNRISIHEFPLICHIVNVGLTGRSLPGLSDWKEAQQAISCVVNKS